MPLVDEPTEVTLLSGNSIIFNERTGASAKVSAVIASDGGLVGLSIASILGDRGDDVRVEKTGAKIGRSLSEIDVDDPEDGASLIGAFRIQTPVDTDAWLWMADDGAPLSLLSDISTVLGQPVFAGSQRIKGTVQLVGLSARIKYSHEHVAKSYSDLVDIKIDIAQTGKLSAGDLVITEKMEICGIVVGGAVNRVIAVPCKGAIMALGELARRSDIRKHNMSFERRAITADGADVSPTREPLWFEVRRFERQIATNPRRLARYRVIG